MSLFPHFLFHLIHGNVGAVQHVIHLLVVFAGVRNTVSKGSLLIDNRDFGNGLLHTFRTNDSALLIRFRTNDHKLVATHTEKQVRFGGMDWIVLDQTEGRQLLLSKYALKGFKFGDDKRKRIHYEGEGYYYTFNCTLEMSLH